MPLDQVRDEFKATMKQIAKMKFNTEEQDKDFF